MNCSFCGGDASGGKRGIRTHLLAHRSRTGTILFALCNNCHCAREDGDGCEPMTEEEAAVFEVMES